MTTLPDDVLLIIFGYSDIDTFFSIRALSHKILNLITTHIQGITYDVGRSTFPLQSRIFLECPRPSMQTPSLYLDWLQDLRYHQLTAIMLECRNKHTVHAEDPLGEDLRRSLVKGWMVLDTCYSVVQEVQRICPASLPARPLSEEAPEMDLVTKKSSTTERRRALEVCARVLDLLGGLPLDAIRGYKTLQSELLRSVFSISTLASFAIPPSLPPVDSPAREFSAWVAYRLLYISPGQYWNAWWATYTASGAGTTDLRDAVETAYYSQDHITHNFEAEASHVIHNQTQHVISKVRIELGPQYDRSTGMSPALRQACHEPTFSDIRRQRSKMGQGGSLVDAVFLGKIEIEQGLNPALLPSELATSVDAPVLFARYRTHNMEQRLSGEHQEVSEFLPEWRMVYEEWLAEWQKCEGWHAQVDVIRACEAQSKEDGVATGQ